MHVTLAPTARELLDRLPRVVRARVLGVLHRLESWPRVSGAKPLRGALAGKRRIRTGDYRVQFLWRAIASWWKRSATATGFTRSDL